MIAVFGNIRCSVDEPPNVAVDRAPVSQRPLIAHEMRFTLRQGLRASRAQRPWFRILHCRPDASPAAGPHVGPLVKALHFLHAPRLSAHELSARRPLIVRSRLPVFADPHRCSRSRIDTRGQRIRRQAVRTCDYIFGVSNACVSLAPFRAAAKSVCLRPSFALASAWINAVLRTSSVVSGIAPLS